MKKQDFIKIAVIVCVLAGSVLLIDRIGAVRWREESQIVRDAVKRAALTCYAVEGAYPMSLDYLCDNYGLAYDENRYRVTYDAFSSNLFPEIRVTEMNQGGAR